ncbi:PucR family transcriptional regulator [Streptomyces sp. NPDC002054]|uniref:PucR family transcriptional regulator n=1 Tax=Streptomyces sp. NPDC002054 TaxID=3154663 RepID=UPI0033212038
MRNPPVEPPATPPTPPVGLGALLGERELGLRLVAGPPEAAVHGVHASEMADPTPYLLGGELLLTAGAWAGDPAEYVARLARAGVAALGFGVTPVHERVPEPLLTACGAAGLPLVEVEPGTPFTAVARTVWRLMAEARTRELRRVTTAQQSLAAAAARPNPVPAVLTRLAAALGGHAELLPGGARREGAPVAPGSAQSAGGRAGEAPGSAERGGNRPERAPGRPGRAPGSVAAAPGGRAGEAPGVTGRAASVAGRVPPPEARAALAALAVRVGGSGPATATDTAAGWHLSAYALTRRPEGADAPEPPGPGAGPVASPVLGVAVPGERRAGDRTIASIAAVLLSLLTAERPATPGPEAAALTRVLLGDPGAGVGGLPGSGPWTVVHASGDGDPTALAASLGTALVDPGPGPGAVRLITDRDPAPQPGWRLGVSAPAGAGDLVSADAQAAGALRRAEAARAPLARHHEGGLASLVPAAAAEAHATALLAPLNPALRETLRAWLAHHGSWDRTATALGVHRNTVRQRITRCAALLARDLDDPDVRMELWFALSRRQGLADR